MSSGPPSRGSEDVQGATTNETKAGTWQGDYKGQRAGGREGVPTSGVGRGPNRLQEDKDGVREDEPSTVDATLSAALPRNAWGGMTG